MSDIRRVLSYNDVLMVPRYSHLDHLSDADILYEYKNDVEDFKAIPLINAPMDKVCSPRLLNLLHNKFGIAVTIHRVFDSVNDQIKFYESCNFIGSDVNVFIAVGMKQKWENWIRKLIDYRTEKSLKFGILIDVAQGDCKGVLETVTFIRHYNMQKPINIMCGNIATKSALARLQDAGANFIRCGVGSGAACSTRENIGFGVPTFTILMDCFKVKYDNVYLIGDGGVECDADIIKGIGIGGDMIMCGKLFCATDLSPSIKVDKDFNITNDEDEYYYCEYSGLASREAALKLKSRKTAISIEGISGFVRYKGKTEQVIEDVCSHMRSALSYYSGCKDWKTFQKKIKFQEITHNGLIESNTRLIKKD
ncbi:MAG: IMP dehydrogenase [Candidatus Woesearchaeota archaeon]